MGEGSERRQREESVARGRRDISRVITEEESGDWEKGRE